MNKTEFIEFYQKNLNEIQVFIEEIKSKPGEVKEKTAYAMEVVCDRLDLHTGDVEFDYDMYKHVYRHGSPAKFVKHVSLQVVFGGNPKGLSRESNALENKFVQETN